MIRSTIDAFHNPRAIRYRRGRHSPESYFRDSFDLDTVRAALLAPLGPGGSLSYRRANFDHVSDSPVRAPTEQAPRDAVLLFDGLFLHRLELRAHWDLSVFLDAPHQTIGARSFERDGVSTTELKRRYVEGWRLYERECRPHEQAALVIDYNALERPSLHGAEQHGC